VSVESSLVGSQAEAMRARGVRLMSVGTATSVAIPLALAPIWGRIFPVSDFATASLIQVVPGLVTSWAALTYQAAIQTPDAEADAVTLVALSLSLVAIVTMIAAGAVFMAGGTLVRLVRSPLLADWLWAIPVLILANGVRLVVDQWMIRRGMLGELGWSMVVSTLVGAIFTALGLLDAFPGNSVAAGIVAGVSAGALWRLSRSRVWHELRTQRPSTSEVVAVARQFRNFPRDGVVGSAVTNIGLQLPQVLLSRFFGPDVAGQYARAIVLIGVPASVLGQPIAASFTGAAGLAFRTRGTCRPEVERALKRLASLLAPAYIVLGLLAPFLLPFVLGPSWAQAGLLAQPMVLSMMAITICGPFGVVLLFANRTGVNLLWQLGWLAVGVLGLLAGIRAGSPVTALWGHAIANCISYLIYLMLAWRYSAAKVVGRALPAGD